MGAARRQWRRRNQRTIMTMTFGSNPTYHRPQSPSPIYGFMSPWGICEKLNDSQSSAEKRQGQFIEQPCNTRSREASKTLKGPCTFVAARIRICDPPVTSGAPFNPRAWWLQVPHPHLQNQPTHSQPEHAYTPSPIHPQKHPAPLSVAARRPGSLAFSSSCWPSTQSLPRP